MPKITITDIDGTIIERGQPVENVLDYIDELNLDVIVLTNRPESDRDRTVQDLADADLEYTRLIMNGGSMPAPEFKKGEVKKLLDEGFDPEVIDLISLKPLDFDTIGDSIRKTHRVIIALLFVA